MILLKSLAKASRAINFVGEFAFDGCSLFSHLFIKLRIRINRARKSRVYLACRYEIHGIIASLGTVRASPRIRSHVKSMGILGCYIYLSFR